MWLILCLLMVSCASTTPVSDQDYQRAMERQNEEEWSRQLQMQ